MDLLALANEKLQIHENVSLWMSAIFLILDESQSSCLNSTKKNHSNSTKKTHSTPLHV